MKFFLYLTTLILITSCKFSSKNITERVPEPFLGTTDSASTSLLVDSNYRDPGRIAFLDSLRKDSIRLAFLDSLRKDSIRLNSNIKQDPENYSLYAERGLFEFKHGNKQDALTDYQKVLTLNPKDSNANFNLGIIEFELGDYRGARKNFFAATEINVLDADAFYFLGLSEINLFERVRDDVEKRSSLKENACRHLSTAGQLGSRKAYEEMRSFCN